MSSIFGFFGKSKDHKVTCDIVNRLHQKNKNKFSGFYGLNSGKVYIGDEPFDIPFDCLIGYTGARCDKLYCSNDEKIGFLYHPILWKFKENPGSDSELFLDYFGKTTGSNLFEERTNNLQSVFRYLEDLEIRTSAVVCEYINNQHYLWLLSFGENILYLIDMRIELGQIFFCSAPENCKSVAAFKEKNLIVIPSHQFWAFGFNESVRRLKISLTKAKEV